MTDLIEEAIEEWFGPRCEDYEPDCACCQAWKQLDDLVNAKNLLAEGMDALRHCSEDIEKGWLAIERVEELYNTDNSWAAVQNATAVLEKYKHDR